MLKVGTKAIKESGLGLGLGLGLGGKALTITLPVVPSINKFLLDAKNHRMAGGRFEALWREKGYYAALEVINSLGLERPMLKRARVSIFVYYQNNQRRDVHNLYFKPVLDGFTDAGIWADDSVVEELEIMRMANDQANPRVEFTIEEF